MKLTEAMGKTLGAQQSVAHEGGPCPFCDGERKIVVYLSVTVRWRNVGHISRADAGQSATGLGLIAARPGFWQGACMECASEIQDDLARRANRYDYLEKVRGEDAE